MGLVSIEVRSTDIRVQLLERWAVTASAPSLPGLRLADAVLDWLRTPSELGVLSQQQVRQVASQDDWTHEVAVDLQHPCCKKAAKEALEH